MYLGKHPELGRIIRIEAADSLLGLCFARFGARDFDEGPYAQEDLGELLMSDTHVKLAWKEQK